MRMAHKNVETLKRIDAAQVAGDIEGFFREFADDVVVHVPGSSSLAGEHKGKEQFKALFERFVGLAGDYSFEPHSYLGDDEHGMALQRAVYAKDGKRLSADEAFVCHFDAAGNVSEVWFISYDQAAFDQFIG